MFHLYGAIIGLGIVIAMSVAEKVTGGKLRIWEAFWWMVLPALLGARLYHVSDKWEYYSQDLARIFDLSAGGLAIYGAIAGAFVGLLLYSYLRAKKIDGRVQEEFFIMGDIYALVAPLAQSVGRWGNYVNGELWGVEAVGLPWRNHPLFLYESVLNLFLFLILLIVYRRKVRGSTFGGYLIGYGVIRITLEPLRQEVFRLGEISVAQAFGVGAIILGLVILLRESRFVWPSSV